jgi:hypothetical protein
MSEPLPQPPAVIEAGTGIVFTSEPNGSIKITAIPAVLHDLEDPPEIGLGKSGDWAKVGGTDLYTNVGGTWLWVR